MTKKKCSYCDKPIEREGNSHWPFCSESCQQRDLGNWLDENYGLPWEDPAREEPTDISDPDEDEPKQEREPRE